MTHGTIGGMLITYLINGNDNPWKDLYDPGRISVKAAKARHEVRRKILQPNQDLEQNAK